MQNIKNQIDINAEYLNNSSIFAIHKKKDTFDFFTHLRYYQPHFKPFLGKHFRRLNPDFGEKGLIVSLKRKLNKTKYSIGVEFYNPLKVLQYKEYYINSRFYFNIHSKINNHEVGLYIEQRRFKEEFIFYKNQLEFFSFQNSTYNKLGISIIFKKNLLIKLQTIQLLNNLDKSQSYSFSIRHTGFQFFTAKIKFGFIKFSVPNWQVRTFNYQPGLPGEFLLNAHNGNGISLFYVYSLPISEQSNFHLRTSIEKLKSKKISYKIGLQLNIGF